MKTNSTAISITLGDVHTQKWIKKNDQWLPLSLNCYVLNMRSLPVRLGTRRWRPKSEPLGIVVRVVDFAHYIGIAVLAESTFPGNTGIRIQIADALRWWWRHASYVDRLVCLRGRVVSAKNALRKCRTYISITASFKTWCRSALLLNIYGKVICIKNEQFINCSGLEKYDHLTLRNALSKHG